MAIILVTEEAIPPVYRFSLTEKLAITLAERGIKVHLVCRKGMGDFRHQGIFYHPVDVKDWSLFNLKKRAEANLRLIIKIWDIIRNNDVRLVYGWWPVLLFARIAGTQVAADMPEFIDVMYRSFNKPFSFFVSPLLRSYQKTVARMSKFIITESDFARAVWASRGIDYSKTFAIPYGVDVDFFISSPRNDDFRKGYGITEDDKIIMYHGDIGIDDGVDILIEATRGLNVKVVIIGDGDPAYMRFLKGISHKNVLFTGWIPYHQIPGVLKNADIYVAPFRCSLYTNTTYPLKIMEAMAAGRPVIVSHLHTMSFYLRDELDCLFFIPSDINSLKFCIQRLLSDTSLMRNIALRATGSARKYFDYKIRIKKEADLLISLI